MLYRRLADLVYVVHFLTVLFFLFGGFVALALPRLAIVHFPLAVWVSVSYLLGWTCPLTPLEKRLRRAAGDEVYRGGFVDHCMSRMFGFALTADDGRSTIKTKASRRKEMILGIVFSVWTVVLYGANFQRFSASIWPPPRGASQPVAAELTFHVFRP